MAQDMDDIIGTLENVSELLAERAIDLLRQAIDSGTGSKPADEKTITQARRAVEKALNLLKGLPVTND